MNSRRKSDLCQRLNITSINLSFSRNVWRYPYRPRSVFMRTVPVIGLALVALLLVPVVLVAVRRIRERLSLRTGFSALGEWLWTNSGIAAQTKLYAQEWVPWGRSKPASPTASSRRLHHRHGGPCAVAFRPPSSAASLLQKVYSREVYLILTCPFACVPGWLCQGHTIRAKLPSFSECRAVI